MVANIGSDLVKKDFLNSIKDSVAFIKTGDTYKVSNERVGSSDAEIEIIISFSNIVHVISDEVLAEARSYNMFFDFTSQNSIALAKSPIEMQLYNNLSRAGKISFGISESGAYDEVIEYQSEGGSANYLFSDSKHPGNIAQTISNSGFISASKFETSQTLREIALAEVLKNAYLFPGYHEYLIPPVDAYQDVFKFDVEKLKAEKTGPEYAELIAIAEDISIKTHTFYYRTSVYVSQKLVAEVHYNRQVYPIKVAADHEAAATEYYSTITTKVVAKVDRRNTIFDIAA